MKTIQNRDSVFNVTGIEERDINLNITKLKLREDEEFKQIFLDFQAKKIEVMKELTPQI